MFLNFFKRKHDTFDSEIVELIFQHKNGITTDKENCYLREIIRKNPEARKLFNILNGFSPDKSINIVCKRKIWIACIIALLFFSGFVYAMFYLKNKNKISQQIENRFYKVPIKDLIDQAKKQYNVNITLDQADIGKIQSSGSFNSKISLKQFLDNSTFVNGLEYYTDSQNVIHIKRK